MDLESHPGPTRTIVGQRIDIRRRTLSRARPFCKLRKNEQGQWYFYVQNVGVLRMCYHRRIPDGAQIKHVVLKQVNQHWYACLMLELAERETTLRPIERITGVDVGLSYLLVLSDGRVVDTPRALRESLAELRQLNQHAARQVKGSQGQQ